MFGNVDIGIVFAGQIILVKSFILGFFGDKKAKKVSGHFSEAMEAWMLVVGRPTSWEKRLMRSSRTINVQTSVHRPAPFNPASTKTAIQRPAGKKTWSLFEVRL